jgi:hypothetical protein
LQFLQALQFFAPVHVAEALAALPIFAAIIIAENATAVAKRMVRFIRVCLRQQSRKYFGLSIRYLYGIRLPVNTDTYCWKCETFLPII